MEKMKKVRDILLCALFLLIFAVGGLLLFLLPKESYSETERRQLASAPAWSFRSVANGSFFTGADRWAADHFEARDSFRKLKATWQIRVLRAKENNGYTIVDGSVVRLEKELNEASVDYAAGRLRAICDEYLAGTDCRIYCAVIPDKSYFLSDRGYPVMDFEKMESLFCEGLPGARPISLKESLALDDYYLTDSHWRQERILQSANLLLKTMGRPGTLISENFEKRSYAPFYGVYAKQSALDPPPEEIVFLTGGAPEAMRVFDFSTMRDMPLYDPEGCDSRDPYTLFLGGSKGLLRIENPNVTDKKELVVFRDSYGSSIAPLLAAEYSAVTLIDTRYCHPSLIARYLRFGDQDVLFLYSALLLNNSSGLN